MKLITRLKNGEDITLSGEYDAENIIKFLQAMLLNQAKQGDITINTDNGVVKRKASDVDGIYIKF